MSHAVAGARAGIDRRFVGLAALLAAVVVAPVRAQTGVEPIRRVQVAAGAAYLTSGDYFTGPGDVALTNGDAAAANLALGFRLTRQLALVLSAAHARPDWRLSGVPIVGSVGVPGARLWFFDAALRGYLPVSPRPRGPALMAQVGAGLARYAIHTTVLGRTFDDHANNFTVALGAGAQVPVSDRVGIELLVKDYIASFETVEDFAEFGVEGRRAHTFLFLGGVFVDF